ncbi:hypothetical protein [Lelliottia wanjuensis]|uniref:hypothetical protein n=1 Tax=Lelliottia wanjuensis TaxID=3050585 RepID=UPI002549D6B8|nr:hypothetical protein [Lelliottia sp. V86_10]MDK9586712.1 hypothetical protein [Lelliottia sp. V86_10]
MSRTVFGRTKQQFMVGILAAYQGVSGVDAIDSVNRWEAWFDKHAADGEEGSASALVVDPQSSSAHLATAVINRAAIALGEIAAKFGCVPGNYLPGLMDGLRQETSAPGYVESLLAQPGGDKCAN